MATGDDNWALMVQPNTLPCGCYVGIWHGVTPPPKCAQHSNEFINTAPPWTSPPAPIEQQRENWEELLRKLQSPAQTPDERRDTAMRELDEMLATGRLDVSVNRSPDPLSKALGNLRTLCRHIITLAEANESNPAAHDAWQLALQHLEPLRAAIERARKAGEG